MIIITLTSISPTVRRVVFWKISTFALVKLCLSADKTLRLQLTSFPYPVGTSVVSARWTIQLLLLVIHEVR